MTSPAAERARGAVARIGRAWDRLGPDQRLAAVAAIALLASMLLPWYQESGNAIVAGKLVRIEDSKNAFGVYSFIEGAIFLVVAGVLVMLFARGERKAFHLPGGDGTVVMAAGLWVMFLIFYRQLDKPNGRHEGMIQTTVGVQWGIFIAFLLGALLAYSGYRIRASHVPEPAADDVPPPAAETVPAPAAVRTADDPAEAPTARVRRRPPPPDEDSLEGQLSFDEPGEYRPPPRRRR
jgi:hypothetical protein